MLVAEDREANAEPAEKREGAVMLVVMLILMVATASAAVSVHSTASELHAAGQERLALQTGYMAETAMMTTIAWADIAGDSWNNAWAAQQPPLMYLYGEPNLDPNPQNRHMAMRAIEQMEMDMIRPAIEVYPVTQPATSGSGGGGGSGGSSGSNALFNDQIGIGSFGPKQAYGLARDDRGTIGYAVDFTDCAVAPSTTPGNQLGGSGGGLTYKQFNCTLTAHARLQMSGAPTRKWLIGGNPYNQDRTMSARDSRATILTAPTLVQ